MTTTQNTALQDLAIDIARTSKVIVENALDDDASYDYETLNQLGQIVRMAVAATTLQVALARANGASWEAVGDALNMSRQGAWERYA